MNCCDSRQAVIVSAVRTAIGSFGGSLKGFSAVELGTIVVKEALERAKVSPEKVDEVIMGNVLQAGQGQNVARQILIHSGIPQDIPAYTVNMVCGSGLKTVALAAQSIAAGEADIVVAGGTESMTNSPYLLPKARWGQRMGDGKLVDEMIIDGLWDIFNEVHMGITAENIAEKFGISREEQDQLAAESQRRAVAAIKAGHFKHEIVPVEIKDRKGNVTLFERDEFPREGVTAESLAKLRPAFKKEGTVTAGNASGINDGSCALVIMSPEKADELGIKPLATILSYATAGVDPAIMGTGPIPASTKALERAGLSIDDIEAIEANEAFASQALSVAKGLNLDMAKVNTRGGAIALGHPIGASGARVLTTLVHRLKDDHKKLGLATLCIGGGMGIAMVVKAE